ncbi:MAG: hypothetical protein AAGC53_21380 [Actinomycetota bacterium]
MTWLRRTLDHLFTEPRDTAGPERCSARRKREIEIEARRGVLGF